MINHAEYLRRGQVIDALKAATGVFEYGMIDHAAGVDTHGSRCPLCGEPMGLAFGTRSESVAFDCWGGCPEEGIAEVLGLMPKGATWSSR